ncbi:histidine ammonia-lyase [Burkholderia sp. ABCPW 14]|uniref:histidine ammonia-lyase n=1 Tax=Burkholderia sp. ABCPW 14 TaxID=1637860 RepID=UPI000770C6F4|nr:histidine ammonia-lyase [Burkholderia sp. ABCPW 14]KVD81908.1 histidine ammonia-lyase [Burkholderia sp. ABCPW 14]
MDLRFPGNSAELVAMRKGGNVPALPVLVTLAGPLPWSNTTLRATAGERYDWRPIRALDVEVFASRNVAWSDLVHTLADIAAAIPNTLALTFREGPSIDCGQMRVVPGQDFALFDWLPLPLDQAHWHASRVIANRLLNALGRDLPNPYDRACELVLQLADESHANVAEVA